METKYYLAIGVVVFWITLRIILMRRRAVLLKRRHEREEARLREEDAGRVGDIDAEHVDASETEPPAGG